MLNASTLVASAGTTTAEEDGVQVIVTTPERTTVTPAKKPAKRIAARASVRPERRAGVAPPAISSDADAVVANATALLGRPYVFGGASPDGFDCSGFTQYVYARAGIRIPRTADQQFAAGRQVAGDPQPGDLVFFQTYEYGASHVAIYLGDGRFVNAIGSDVHVADFDSPYFRSRYLGARRFLPD